MLNTPILSNEQIKTFENDGYLIVSQAFTPEEMKCIDTWTQELVALPKESGKHWVFHERSLKGDGADLISRIENIAPFHAGFEELCTVLKAPVAQLLGEEAVLFKEKINFKMAGGDGFKPHQDSQAGWDAYADFFISALVCIDEATVENGCLQLVTGHHKRGLFKSWEPLTENDMADMELVHCPTKPGDVVFFDCYAPHASDPNMTDQTRRIFFATYNRLSEGDHLAQYYADKYKNYPPDIDRESGKKYVFRV
ncbi:MAG: phytanoyl-CoA dioxygenase family protein [Proteobacteria bacterium]|nr:phytanoyl-CoA dioxygenase family protein [Pseudomonadota bacterium]